MDKNIRSKKYLDHKKYLTSGKLPKGSGSSGSSRWTSLLYGRNLPRKANLKIHPFFNDR